MAPRLASGTEPCDSCGHDQMCVMNTENLLARRSKEVAPSEGC